MAFINYSSREIQLKIVYYGAALCGKTTNLVTLHKQITHAQKGELVSLATDADRTLFFDFLSLNTKTLPGSPPASSSTPFRARRSIIPRASSC